MEILKKFLYILYGENKTIEKVVENLDEMNADEAITQKSLEKCVNQS